MLKLRKTAALLLAVMLIMCACAQAEPEVVPEYDTNVSGSAVDLGGYTVRWGFGNTIADKDDCVFGFVTDTSFADLALDRKKAVEDAVNCKFELDYNDSVRGTFDASVVSGSRFYDVVTFESYFLLSEVRGGYFYGLSPYLDLKNTDKYGTPSLLLSVSYKNDVYCVVPYAWPQLLYTSFGNPIVVNENLIARYGHDDPREFVENATWTWDKFEECLLAYTVKDGENQIYGIASHPPYFNMLMFLSNGVSFTENTDQGIVCGLYTPAGIQAMERAQSMFRVTCHDCFFPGESNASVVECFKNEGCVLYPSGAGGIVGDRTSLIYVMDNIGIVPFPLGPNAEPGVYRSYHESLNYSTGIPINAEMPDASALIIDMMYEPFEGYETKEQIIDYLSSQVFFDPRDAKVFINMLGNSEYNFQNNGGRAAIEQVRENKTITEMLEGLRSNYDTLLEEYMIPHFEGRLAVFGE